MRPHLPLLALALCAVPLLTAAAPPGGGGERLSPPPREQGAGNRERVCRDRIHVVRAERGLPALEREAASADEPLLIAAVDRRIDECSVMVMLQDTNDIRPLPAPEEGPLFRRLPGQ